MEDHRVVFKSASTCFRVAALSFFIFKYVVTGIGMVVVNASSVAYLANVVRWLS